MNELLELEHELGPLLRRALDTIVPTDPAEFAIRSTAAPMPDTRQDSTTVTLAVDDGWPTTTDAMIPTLVVSEIAATDERSVVTPDELVIRRRTSAQRSRRLAVAALSVAAMLVGLIVIAGRDTGDVAPAANSQSTDSGTPAWYDMIAPSLPELFQSVALTHATDEQLFFVAINPLDGKTLEIQLASGGYSAEPTTTVDATGEWVETAHGWSVRTPAGLFISVTCDIGVGDGDLVGPENYCDLTEGITAFTKDEIRATVKALATSLTLSIFGQDVGTPGGDTIDIARASALISAEFPGQQIDASDTGHRADLIYNIGGRVGDVSPPGTVPTLDAISTPSAKGASVRIVHGVVPPATVDSEPVINGYHDAAVVSMFGSGGVYVRISMADARPGPESVTRLAELARNLIRLDPTTANTGSRTIATAVVTTTTSAEFQDTPDGNTTTTLASCDSSSPPPLAVLVNASSVSDTATWWTNVMRSNVPTVDFADPLEAIARASVSRVLALNTFECNASLLAQLTTGAVEPATAETLQALTAQQLPVGTSIVVVIGDDFLSAVTPGVTTTSAAP